MDSEIRNIQLKCLEIFDIFHRICTEHGIRYSLCGGTVVGAHLYQGCLPWDDDLDVMMNRVDFNRFVAIAPSALPEGFELVGFETDHYLAWPFPKIVNTATTVEQDTGEVYGVYMDIVCFDRIPLNPVLRRVDQFLWDRMWTAKTGKRPGKGLKNLLRNLTIDLFAADKVKTLQHISRAVQFIGSLSSHYTYAEFFGLCGMRVHFNPQVFENYTTITFEGRQCMIVRDYVEYLTTRYNRTDFREPKELQVPPHKFVFVDFHLPYREYLKHKTPDSTL